MKHLPIFSGNEIGNRLARLRKNPTQKKRIFLPPGRYFLEEPIILGPEDNGLVIEGAGGEETFILGAKRITGWKKEGKFWVAYLPQVRERKWDFRHLYVDALPVPRARLPEKGFLEHESVFDGHWMSTTYGGWDRKPSLKELTTLIYKKGDIGKWFDPVNAEVTVHHCWDESLVGVAKHDSRQRKLIFSPPSGHPPGAFGVKTYVVWNLKQGMHYPGQWYLERNQGKLVYWPRSGEEIEETEVWAPILDTIIFLQGKEDEPVRDISFSNFSLAGSGSPLRAGGFGACEYPGAIELRNVCHCQFRQVSVFSTGAWAIRGEGKCIRVENCEIHHTGAGGINLQGDDHEIKGNRLHQVGTSYRSGIGIRLAGRTAKIIKNHIFNTPYSAIVCSQDGHLIQANSIEKAVTQLTDGAAIYITFCKNVTLRGNLVSQIKGGRPPGASAYYLDEQASHCLVENNLAVEVDYPSHNHMASNNSLVSNIYINRKDMRITFPRCSNYIFRGNLLWSGGKIVFTNLAAITQFENNFLSSQVNRVLSLKLNDYSLIEEEDFSLGENILVNIPIFCKEKWARV
ncbi:MAG: right-handed parallel beta-helix repeat-containing protein [Candidatus Omnitrophica bacterium]|nr:right-handed parallel beta-helix repeat-containing protein [Candidatus Omnitrophota bacterium]